MKAGLVRGRAVFWALLALTAVTRLALALADHRSLIANDVYSDDAFYYLRIAANVASGRGLTFDGQAPTNGFQPLYLLMLVPIMGLCRGNLILPIHLSGVLLTAWSVATGAVLYALLSALSNRRVALFGLLVWAICPYFALMSVNGLETGVSTFFVVLLPWLYLIWFRGHEPPRRLRALAFGVAAGLAILARVDLVLLLAVIAVDAAFLHRRRVRQGAVLAGLALAGCAGVWLPWGIASAASTGHWLPLSGAASRLIAIDLGWHILQPIWTLWPHGPLFDPQHVPASFYADVATKLAFTFVLENPLLAPLRANEAGGPWANLDSYAPYQIFRSAPSMATAVLVIVGAAVVARLRPWRRRAPQEDGDSVTTFRRCLVWYLGLVAAGYTFYSPAHWYFNRYLVGPILLTMVALLVAAGAAPIWSGRARVVTAVVAVAILACQLTQWRFVSSLRWSAAAPVGGFLANWQALGPRVDPGSRVGAFQAGIYGYFSGRDVINLDGKVNQDAFEALRAGRVHEYIRARDIRYVLDSEWMLRDLCERFAPAGAVSFRPLASAPNGSSVRLFEVVDAH